MTSYSNVKMLYLLKAKFPQYMRLRTPIAFTKHSCRVQGISAMFASGYLHILTPHKTDFEYSSVSTLRVYESPLNITVRKNQQNGYIENNFYFVAKTPE